MRDPEQMDWSKELRSLLEQSQEPYAWVTGKMILELRDGHSVEGKLQRLEDDDQIAILNTASGEVPVSVAQVVNAIVSMSSPGPE